MENGLKEFFSRSWQSSARFVLRVTEEALSTSVTSHGPNVCKGAWKVHFSLFLSSHWPALLFSTGPLSCHICLCQCLSCMPRAETQRTIHTRHRGRWELLFRPANEPLPQFPFPFFCFVSVRLLQDSQCPLCHIISETVDDGIIKYNSDGKDGDDDTINTLLRPLNTTEICLFRNKLCV